MIIETPWMREHVWFLCVCVCAPVCAWTDNAEQRSNPRAMLNWVENALFPQGNWGGGWGGGISETGINSSKDYNDLVLVTRIQHDQQEWNVLRLTWAYTNEQHTPTHAANCRHSLLSFEHPENQTFLLIHANIVSPYLLYFYLFLKFHHLFMHVIVCCFYFIHIRHDSCYWIRVIHKYNNPFVISSTK